MVLELLFALSALLVDTAPTQLRVASYNAWLIPLVSDEFFERRDAMAPAIEGLAPDVLCLQEVWDQLSMDALRASLAPRLPFVIESGGGLALLSRWPMINAHFTPYPADDTLSFAERIGKKGWIDAIIATPSGAVRIVNTHMVHSRGGDRSAHGRQLEALERTLDVEPHLPTVLCGDLNFRAIRDGLPSDELRTFLHLGFTDPAAELPGPDGLQARRAATRLGWPRQEGRTRGSDPDYLLDRSGSRRRLRHVVYRQALDTPAEALSDHNLQIVDLLLE
jgi:endonuclease/exonuclease/phosphatase family metal-dependent hydrolase